MSGHVLVADDGLRNHDRSREGTNRVFPCGHPRIAGNVRSCGRCTLCRRRIERESKQRSGRA